MFDEKWFLTAGPVVVKPVIFAEFSEWENGLCILEKHYCHEQVQLFDMYPGFYFC